MNVFVLPLVVLSMSIGVNALQQKSRGAEKIRLPQPKCESSTSLERALHKRRSVRDFKRNESLTLDEVAQLLWAAQGVTHKDGLRTSPSAGALYPLELYLVAGNVKSLSPGVYRYLPREHAVVKVAEGDMRKQISTAASSQEFLEDATAILVISGVYERTTKKYRERGKRYVHFEAGHASQNIYLQAVSLNLGTVAVGAFHDAAVKRLLNMGADEEPLYLMPVGKK
jgi:SagB-type dehydrogenase family enzyme